MTATDGAALSPLKRALVEIRELKARVAAADRREHHPIAIVGAGVRLPGGVVDLDSYWHLLANGIDAIIDVPADRWDAAALYDEDPDAVGRTTTRRGGFVDGVDRFDASFFGMSPREADSLDPQQRMVLEVAWEALEDANIPASDLFGAAAGVFVGIGNSDYMRMLLDDLDEIDTYAATGTALSVAAGRVSYVLGATGPAISIDTACSSSLVAVHLAVRSLRSGECDVALAGGVNAMLSPALTVNFSHNRMMAPDGRCKTFDAAADGYVRSEGCGMIALKRLDDAVAAGDRILAVIRGSAVNQDGRSGGITAPNGPAQERVVRAALRDAQVAPLDIGYVEAHGTGTLLGDPIEVGALGGALCVGRPAAEPLLLGSVKTNIGHTETAAGVAGLLKVVLTLRHGQIPAHLHLTELNPYIAAAGLPIDVPTALRPWPQPTGRRFAGVSSFGLSGTNAHVVLGEAPPEAELVAAPAAARPDEMDGERPNVVTISARDEVALAELAARTAAALGSQSPATLAAVARTANIGRAHLDVRRAVVATTTAEAIERLDGIAAGAPRAHDVESIGTGGIAFLFTGHGAQYPGMGRGLYEAEPVFAAAFDRCADLARGELDRPLADVVFGAGDGAERMTTAQPGLFALQYALAEQWTSWGIRPTIVAGHSAGEYVAAVLAGVLTLEDGMRLICARGRLMDTLDRDGVMAALFVDEEAVAGAVARHAGDVGIAAVNGPFTTVVSGRRGAVEAVVADLALDDDDLRWLPVSVAAHSPLVDPILESFETVVRAAELHRPGLGLVSSMTGELVDAELTDPTYWRRHLRAPVRFADVFATVRATGCRTFVEIGPGATLLNLGRRNQTDGGGTWVASLRAGGDEHVELLEGMATLYEAGADIDWRAFAEHPARRAVGRPVHLPNYPWQRRRHWSAAASGGRSAAAQPMWPAAVAAGRVQAEQGPLDLDAAAYPSRWLALDRFAGRAIANALVELGLLGCAGDRVRPTELIAGGTFAAAYDHLAVRWLDHLVDDGLLRRDGDEYVADQPLTVVDLAGAAAELRTDLRGLEPLADYAERCAHLLAAVVRGDEPALSTLFPEGSYETADFLYGGWAVQRYFNSIAGAVVAGAAASRQGRPFHVVEVGAGSGGTSAVVLPALARASTAVSYTFTDVSDFFLVRAAERFAEHAFVRYNRLDIERPPGEQGLAAGSADVVLAANVLHATRDLDATLANVRALLAPGGLAVIYESTSHPRWLDVTTGLIEGWQRFADPWRTGVPLIDTDRWCAALAAAGFEDVEVLPADGASTSGLLQHVLVARAPGDDRSRAGELAFAAPAGVASTFSSVPAPSTGVRARLEEALESERHDIVVDAVRAGVAFVLRIGDLDRLGRDLPLLDLGFDSLMAVELRNVLRRSFELAHKLPATLVFDHPSIGAIATYLDGIIAGVDVEPVVVAEQRPAPSPQLDVAAVAALDDDEVEALLLAKLMEIES